ncbi:hypothetical protein [Chitinophaga sp. sic0106]|uniref:hypothetical protein n=1 Tax=Chitinophaga sp. sic0106 TaxID=2854785 RepID=UPI001C474BE5|nr:hypothetical protein [Chitinophaga sp. sic0106]MBV7530634.1 hypothetical protein [Chitinophaga sp. sic0106]
MIRIKFLLSVLLFFAVNQLSAQSHVTTPGSFCKYAKNSLRNKNIYAEGHTICPACDKEDEKEATARKAENKRREDAKNAAIAAENLAKQRALDAEMKRKRDADKGVTELGLKMSPTKGSTGAPPPVEIDGMKAGYFYDDGQTDNQSVSYMIYYPNQSERNNQIYKLYSDINYFVLNGKKILDNDEFKYCIGVRRVPGQVGHNTANFPPGVGIAVLNKIVDDHVVSDLVDATGKRLFNNDNISTIVHFTDDWFILMEGKPFGLGGHPYYGYQFPAAKFYNYKTGETFDIPNAQPGSRSYVQISAAVNGSYMLARELRDASTYRAYIRIYGRDKSTVYFITNEGKLEWDEVNK